MAMSSPARSGDAATVLDGSLGGNGIALLVLLCGALSPIKLGLVGEIYAPELALPLVAAIAAFRGGRRVFSDSAFMALLTAGMVTLLGYILSDLVQGSRPDQFLRGWGRVALVISDFVCLSIIFGQNGRNFWWYSLGAGLGNLLYLRFAQHMPLARWKFGYADPVALASITLGVFVPQRVLSVWLVLLGLHSMWSDFRSFAGFCLAVAAILWVQAGDKKRSGQRGGATTIKLLIAGGVAAAIILVTMSLTAEESAGRRKESNSGREAAIEVGIEAISRSPVIGYGSWTENKELAAMYHKRQDQLSGGSGRVASDGSNNFAPHSQILHAWMEGGILGAALFFSLAYYLLKTSYWLIKTRPADYLTPLLLFSLINALWNLFMSPFSSPHRLGIATGIALIVMLSVERRMQAQVSTAARPQQAAPSPLVPETEPASGGLRLAKRKLCTADRRVFLRVERRQPVLASRHLRWRGMVMEV
jgi:hypothetical protein